MSKSEIKQDVIESIDDFLPIPGAESVVISGDDESEQTKKTEPEKPRLFSNPNDIDLSFTEKLGDEEEEDTASDDEKYKGMSPEEIATAKAEEAEKLELEKQSKIDADKILDNLDNEEEEEEDELKTGKKSKNPGLVNTFQSLIDEGELVAFDDDKPLAQYTQEDFKELLKANIAEKENAIKEQTPKEFYDALPEELQYAAAYVAKGGKDLKPLFAALAQREQVKELDPSNEDHHELIARQYLQATQFGSGDKEILEDQIQEWVESGTIAKKAQQFKPKLDKMQEKVLASQLEQQEKAQQKQKEQKDAYIQNIFETLKPKELNGIPLDTKQQNFLWNELTTTKYSSMTGRPTNLLGKLLEDHQFSDKPRYDLIAEATWLLSDPEGYKEKIIKQGVSESTKKTVKELKTEEGRKLKSSVAKEEEEDTTRKAKPKTIKKQRNIFSPN